MKSISKAYILLCLTLTGCMSWQERMEHDRIEKIDKLADEARQRDNNPNDYNYKLGLKDGCDSGNLAGGSVTGRQAKNVDLYIKDPYYKNGYDDAYSKCKNDSDQLNRAITDSLNRGW